MPTTTRALENGNSQAVRIPADLAYERTDMDLEIELDVTVVTNNLKDFARYPGVVAENWLTSADPGPK